VGIRGSYWLTGGIMTLLGVILARFLAGVLATVAASAGAFLLAAAAFLLKATLVVVGISVLIFLALRGRKARQAG
jgi:hypothetical protein